MFPAPAFAVSSDIAKDTCFAFDPSLMQRGSAVQGPDGYFYHRNSTNTAKTRVYLMCCKTNTQGCKARAVVLADEGKFVAKGLHTCS